MSASLLLFTVGRLFHKPWIRSPIFDCLCCYHYVHQECALSAQWINMTDVDVENSVSKQHIVTLDLKEKLFE